TVVGVKSGSTSTGARHTWVAPTTSAATPAATTKSRNFRLESTIQRSMLCLRPQYRIASEGGTQTDERRRAAGGCTLGLGYGRRHRRVRDRRSESRHRRVLHARFFPNFVPLPFPR